MFKKKKIPYLSVMEKGEKSRVYKLSKPKATIGTDKKCSIRLTGEYVSDLHAIVEKRDDGNWVVTNNSPNGTYLNESKMEMELLQNGGVIQIGTDCKLEFCTGETVATVSVDDGEIQSGKEKKKIGKWPLIIGGVVVVYLPLFLYLQNQAKTMVETANEGYFTLAMVEGALEGSQEYLSELSDSDGSDKAKGKVVTSRAADGLANGYYELAYASSLSGTEKTGVVDRILVQSRTHLTNALRYHMMALPGKSIEELQKVMQLVPDHRNPATGFAAKTIANIQYQSEFNGQ